MKKSSYTQIYNRLDKQGLIEAYKDVHAQKKFRARLVLKTMDMLYRGVRLW